MKTGWGLLAAVALVVSLPEQAHAHANLTEPKPRNDVANKEPGPCGGVPRTSSATTYAKGSSITVKWLETIDHVGCFQIALSAANDANFVLLSQIDDPMNGTPLARQTTVQLPADLTCDNCTLVLRQLMINASCAPNAEPPVGETYYSCADIRITGDGDAGPATDAGAAPPAASGVGDPSGSAPAAGSSGPSGNTASSVDPGSLKAGKGGDCSVGRGGRETASAVSAWLAGCVAAASVLRRRRRR